jgi:hypothetical protein
MHRQFIRMLQFVHGRDILSMYVHTSHTHSLLIIKTLHLFIRSQRSYFERGEHVNSEHRYLHFCYPMNTYFLFTYLIAILSLNHIFQFLTDVYIHTYVGTNNVTNVHTEDLQKELEKKSTNTSTYCLHS